MLNDKVLSASRFVVLENGGEINTSASRTGKILVGGIVHIFDVQHRISARILVDVLHSRLSAFSYPVQIEFNVDQCRIERLHQHVERHLSFGDVKFDVVVVEQQLYAFLFADNAAFIQIFGNLLPVVNLFALPVGCPWQ